MLRMMVIGLAASAACIGVVSCASDEARRIDEAARAACVVEGSPVDDPEYDEACMREVREQLQAAKTYRPSTRPPRPKS